MGGKCQNCKSYNTSRITDDQYERKIMEIQNKLNQTSLDKKNDDDQNENE